MEGDSVSQMLAAFGFGHRRGPLSDYGKRELYHIETGVVIGSYYAHEAVAAARAALSKADPDV